MRMRMLSSPRPEYVERCAECGSAFFQFGSGESLSHNDQYQDDSAYQRYLESSNTETATVRQRQTIERLKTMLADVEGASLFDVGAGGGDFLALAQGEGFRVTGNEVSRPAIEACRERHGIELAFGDDLAALATHPVGYDAVTMWCVIAHVDDPQKLLSGVRQLLRPGGILFFSTPRYCVIDRFAFILMRLFGERYRRMFDRRINRGHRRQYSARGVEMLLRSEGFTPLSVTPAIGYGLHMERYLSHIGFPEAVARPAGKALDFLANAGLAPKNILNVYAKVP